MLRARLRLNGMKWNYCDALYLSKQLVLAKKVFWCGDLQ